MSKPQQSRIMAWRQALDAERRAVEESVSKVLTLTDAQIRRGREAESRRENFRQRQTEIAEKSSAVCHDMLLMRSQDEWSLAFGLLVNHSLGHLGLAYAASDERMMQGMVFNLTRLAEETAKAFPDRRMAIDPWKRAIASLGEATEPTHDAKPHPNVESLSRLVLTLRDTGPALKDFRAYYAPFGSALHIIRPA
jgi:hypothetical protein